MARKTSKKPKAQKKRRPILTLFKWGMVLGIWLFIVLLGIIAYYGHDLPDIARAATFERKRSLTFYAADGETVIARYGELLGRNLTFEEMPKNLINAVIATEDRRFYYHFGVDPIGITRAMLTNVQAQKIAQGGSTITQQLAKNLFLSSDRTIRRKISGSPPRRLAGEPLHQGRDHLRLSEPRLYGRRRLRRRRGGRGLFQ